MNTYLEIKNYSQSHLYYVLFLVTNGTLSIWQEKGLTRQLLVTIPISEIERLTIDQYLGGNRHKNH